MNHELPDHLKSTADLLSNSLRIHTSEKAPAIPGELLGDLSARFAPAAPAPAATAKISWFQAAHSYISRPAFGLAAAAAIVAIVALPSLLKPANTGGFRGGDNSQTHAEVASIVLVGAPEATLGMLRDCGDFEQGALVTAADPSTATLPKVVVDFASSAILSINSEGETVKTTPIPASAEDLPAAIAAAIADL